MRNELTVSDYLPISGKKVCCIGNRWHQNFGDELILVGLIQLLCRDDSLVPTKLYISGGDLNFLRSFHDYFFHTKEKERISYLQEIPHGIRSCVHFLFWHSIFAFFQTIKNYLSSDTFIVGWWELFTEETPGSYLYRFRSLLPYRFRKIFFRKTKLYIMWWFQKPKSRYNRAIARFITQYADGCYMRDEESVQDILVIHPHKENVQWFIDTSYFAYNFVGADNIRPNHHQNRPNHDQKHIIINSNPLSGKRTDELLDIVKDYISRWYEVYFLPAFFTNNTQQNDMIVYEYIKNKIHLHMDGVRPLDSADSIWLQGSAQDDGEVKLLDRRNRDEFLIIFNSAEKIFCSRLHIFLIASFLWLDVQAYPYQKKILKNLSILKRSWILK